MAVRIEVEGKAVGLLLVGDKESRRGVGPFRDADRRTLNLFANQAAIALENARLHRQALEKERLEREMELAADIQRQLLPTGTPWLPGFEFSGWNRPTWQVGGDYYDFLKLGGDRLGLLVADVTGKGMPAALLVSTLHSSLRLLFDGAEVGEALLSRLNEHIVRSSSPNKFITHDPRRARARDRPAALVQRRAQPGPPGAAVGGDRPSRAPAGCRSASSPAPPTGRRASRWDPAICSASTATASPSALRRPTRSSASSVSNELLRSERERPLPEIARGVDGAMLDFAAGSPQSDDQTLVLLRRTA